MYEHFVKEDFQRAVRKGFWRKINAWLTGKNNELLPYDEVRQIFPLKGQRYLGLQTIPVENIIGSVGRYRDFDRAFTPVHARTAPRWMSIDMAQYNDIRLPPIEVYKIGEVYFVKDGNHRVSVARERGQAFIDAYVIEIDIPVTLTPDIQPDDLEQKRAYAEFLEQSNLLTLRPDAQLELTLTSEYPRLTEHIHAHQWFMGKQQGQNIPYETAVHSWFENVYLPLVQTIRAQDLPKTFPHYTETDLYLLVSEYSWFLREAYQEDKTLRLAADSFAQKYADWPARKVAGNLAHTLQNAAWLDHLILQQERAYFLEATALPTTLPNAYLELTLPGKYEKLLEHIRVHRWYMGEQQNRQDIFIPIPFTEAVKSWYHKVYFPLIEIIRAQKALVYFPGRTETDLYLWILDHRSRLEEELGWDITPETAATDLVERQTRRISEEIADALLPDSLETGPKPGRWRRERLESGPGGGEPLNRRTFTDLLVSVGASDRDWRALDQALVLARQSKAHIHGLHIVATEAEIQSVSAQAILAEFNQRCITAQVNGKLAIRAGQIARTVADRARFVDLIVLPLNHPPPAQGLARLVSGFRAIVRRAGRPVLAVPERVSPLNKILLAYNGMPRADEGLYLAARLVYEWQAELLVLTVEENGRSLDRARSYLEKHTLPATYLRATGSVDEVILHTAETHNANLIVMGGYGSNPVMEVMLGSTVEKVLSQYKYPVLIST
ncbi:MAG: universal stress protein [Anaerolineales bacterium]|nr:universal stress protein [Anaerolineales bacterium]